MGRDRRFFQQDDYTTLCPKFLPKIQKDQFTPHHLPEIFLASAEAVTKHKKQAFVTMQILIYKAWEGCMKDDDVYVWARDNKTYGMRNRNVLEMVFKRRDWFDGAKGIPQKDVGYRGRGGRCS